LSTLAAAACAALLAGPLHAADDAAQARQRAVNAVANWSASDFKLPAELPIDAGLRREMEALAAEHRARVAELAAAWAGEEAARLVAGTNPRAGLWMPVVARYFNELSLWQLDTVGEAHDRRMLSAMQDPGLCRELNNPMTAFGQVALALQRMPPPDREAALSAQRVLLARWGRHGTPPDRPMPSLKERALSAARALRVLDRAPQEPPLPPLLAWSLRKTSTPALDREDELCVLTAWQLQRPATRAATPGEQALLARYAVVDGWMSRAQSRNPGLSDTGYPNAAAQFGVEGEVVVRGRLRADGTGLDAPRIVARRITVPGIRDMRPVAFETWLDSATLERATKTAPTAKRAAGDEAELRFNWKLQ
jgi:hypothetical protein